MTTLTDVNLQLEQSNNNKLDFVRMSSAIGRAKQQQQQKQSAANAVVDWVSPIPPSLSVVNFEATDDDDADNNMVPATITTTAATIAAAAHNNHNSRNNGSNSSASSSPVKISNSQSSTSPTVPAVTVIPNYGSLSTHQLDLRSHMPVRNAHHTTIMADARTKPTPTTTRSRLKHILIIFACCVVVFPLLYVMALLGPVKSGVDCDRQSSIRRPHRETLTPTFLFTLITTLVTITILVATEFIMCWYCRRVSNGVPEKKMRLSLCARWQIPSWIYFAARNLVAYAFSVHATQGAVFLIRMMVAIPRPDWWEVCQPVFTGGRCPEHQYTTDYECRNKNRQQIWDASRSFPSGHVTFITFNAVFMLLYLERRCRAARLKYDSVQYVLRTIEFWLFVAVFFTSADRVQANAHHPSDVFVGGLFGIVGAIFAFRLLFFAPDGHEQDPTAARLRRREQSNRVDVDAERGNPSRNSVISTITH